MKKWIASALAVMLVTIGASTMVLAAGTESNWSVGLTFSTANTTDILPVTVGEGSADELLKPPPLPGMADTSDPANAIVNSYVITAADRKAARSIDAVDTSLPGKVWALDINVEETSEAVYLEVDMDNFYSKYDLSIIDPDEKTITEFKTDGEKKQLFTSGASGSSKRLFVLAGEYQTAAIKSDNSVFSVARTTGLGHAAGVTVTIYNEGCSSIASGTTDETGTLSLDIGSATGKHYVKFDAVNAVGNDCELQITSGSTGAACMDVLGGDFNDNGLINILDLSVLKPYFGQIEGAQGSTYDATYDLNKNGVINVLDVSVFKQGFNKEEEFECGS